MTRRAFIGRWQRAGIVAALAYALALQALLLSFGGALHAEAGLAEGIVCTRAAGDSAPHAPAQAHDALCCILSCQAAAGSAAPEPVPAGFAHPPARPTVLAFLPEAPSSVGTSGLPPVGSRAPPRLG
ncbi:hypothetical protein [Microvirga thermotolerans]|uniref:DUF2946 domain-containing protein n=1 Tax=Microvirga thermotolerans TaxID=2651334 RepID=A0A5P9JSB6_9HYPH|nr:hypothetical protein [Microvirga thermotolerans]QFU14991.1 hypothetical protein GDR74_01475 [Microvirga thermotolerans]